MTSSLGRFMISKSWPLRDKLHFIIFRKDMGRTDATGIWIKLNMGFCKTLDYPKSYNNLE
jgi:hypothetical protein